jgi:hypothetical protein
LDLKEAVEQEITEGTEKKALALEVVAVLLIQNISAPNG